ncbi:MAG TPA: peptidoglycan editing factor PgeF [Patescibacteria group bacterium]|nr:peptidoglycan editing factor PgeF [Patescibacteria group bacterium]
MNIIDIEKPVIFPEKSIISGVTKRNLRAFPNQGGLSLSPGKILSKEELADHRKAFAEGLGIPTDILKFQNQVHGDMIRVITPDSKTEASDGMITSFKNIVLCIIIADCAAVLMYDPKNSVIAGFHSGWRGTQLNIVGKGINILKDNFKSDPADLLVYVSPCASGERYIVREDVAQHFPRSVKRINNKEYLFDNRMEIQLQLHEAGVPRSNIEVSDGCTIGGEIDYHSYRRDGERSGRMAAFIGMKGESF